MMRLRTAYTALFGSLRNAAISCLMLAVFGLVLPPLWHWAVVAATFIGDSRAACAAGGACWAFVEAHLKLFLYGNYPTSEEWRVHLSLVIVLACSAGYFGSRSRKGTWLVLLALGMLIDAALLVGGMLGLPVVPSSEWGGLMLNLILAFVSVTAAIPIGIALAFARRSQRSGLAWAATAYVEFWRAVPLLAVLFMGVVMLPLFLPQGMTIDNLVRALLVLVLFTSAYMAEVFRGALQAVASGQEEAAASLGLRKLQASFLIVLPQAMRFAVPGIVNIAVDLFKDTSLVSVVGLLDLVGVTIQSLKDPAWLGLSTEAYVFAAMLFFVWCLLISLSGQMVEHRLRAPWRQ
jgi:general L-amino acid transport system permease protein